MNQSNPFIYSTPDQIKNPKDALDLFVDVLRDFYLIESPGNTFINGPRGSGKSMMFRIMKPDCQKISLNKNLNELNYFAIYIPIKNTSLNVEELKYLSGKHGENILNEHFLTTYFTIAIFERLREEDYSLFQSSLTESILFYNNIFLKYIGRAGHKEELIPLEGKDVRTPNEVFDKIISALEVFQEEFSIYLEKLTLGDENLIYSGSICSYRNFLFPLIKEIVNFSFLPKEKPLFLMIDDADLLSAPQTKILNSWVSYRFTSFVCYKISTQLNYKTYYTSSGENKIDSPHDYHEINLTEIYTSNTIDNYKDNLKSIVEKRLKLFSDLDTSAEEFFPEDKKQEIAYKELFKDYEGKSGYDYAYRNARPDYMLRLKNEYSYNYGGFEQLVHLSSGIIRNFIDMSFKMYDKTARSNPDIQITNISPTVQNEEIREYGNWILQQLDKSIDDDHLSPIQSNKFKLLRSLINSMGKAFRLYLESEASERRKFAFYFDGEVSKEVKEVLKLGVSEGLFHESTHGSKTGLGRSKKYVLNRMLSPIYKLDPFSFSGYLYITTEKLELAINDERAFIQYIKDRIKKGDRSEEEQELQTKINF